MGTESCISQTVLKCHSNPSLPISLSNFRTVSTQALYTLVSSIIIGQMKPYSGVELEAFP
jgi:hypothetical protein